MNICYLPVAFFVVAIRVRMSKGRPKDLMKDMIRKLVKLPLAKINPVISAIFTTSHWQNVRIFLVGQCCPIFPFCLS